MVLNARFVVVGGGVAGVCCAEELEALIDECNCEISECSNVASYDSQIILISGCCGFIKVVTHSERVSYTYFLNIFNIFNF